MQYADSSDLRSFPRHSLTARWQWNIGSYDLLNDYSGSVCRITSIPTSNICSAIVSFLTRDSAIALARQIWSSLISHVKPIGRYCCPAANSLLIVPLAATAPLFISLLFAQPARR